MNRDVTPERFALHPLTGTLWSRILRRTAVSSRFAGGRLTFMDLPMSPPTSKEWHSPFIPFFAPAPEPPAPPEQARLPKWMRPPPDVLGGVLPAQHLIAKTEFAAVALSRLVAYPSGFSMDIVIAAREDNMLPNLQVSFRPGHGDREAVERGWRFGIGMADGSKVTIEGGRHPALSTQ